jgi:DNA polymerase III subunit delta'
MSALPPWIDEQLRHLLAQRGHAWLLYGPSGLGQYELALELTRAWLCDDPGPAGACGRCGSCHTIDVRAHTDLFVLMPETAMLARGWPLAEKAQTDIDEKKRKPSKDIRIDDVREAVEFSQRTSGRGRGKVVLVSPAERMNQPSANALLKTLEEPPGDVRFVLATEAAHQLLPTIRSRCQGHAMVWPAPAVASAWLQQQDIDAADVAALLRASGGRPQEALLLAQAGVNGRTWSQLPKALARGEAGLLADWAPPQAVDALQKVCHDVMAVRTGGAPRFFEPADLPPPAGLVPLSDWSRELARTARTAEHPFNPGLMLEALVSKAQGALNSRG